MFHRVMCWHATLVNIRGLSLFMIWGVTIITNLFIEKSPNTNIVRIFEAILLMINNFALIYLWVLEDVSITLN